MACDDAHRDEGPEVLAGQPEANLGIIPGAGGTQRLPRLVGIEEGREMLRTCRPIVSEKAKAYGLIREEVEGDLVAAPCSCAGHGARQGPRRAWPTGPLSNVPASLPAVDIGHLSKKVDEILCKAILAGARKLPLKDAVPFEAKCFGAVCGTQDMRIGVENFLKNGPRAKAEFKHA
jgi:enoyl-CoA hydratase/carnithine racemase